MTPFSFSEKKKLSNQNINKRNSTREVNRGVELILNGGKKQTQPFHIIFEKMVCFFKREVTIYFEFSLKIKEEKLVPRGKNNVSSKFSLRFILDHPVSCSEN